MKTQLTVENLLELYTTVFKLSLKGTALLCLQCLHSSS